MPLSELLADCLQTAYRRLCIDIPTTCRHGSWVGISYAGRLGTCRPLSRAGNAPDTAAASGVVLDRVVVPPRRPSAVSELAFCTRRPGGMGASPDVITARYGDSAICRSIGESSRLRFTHSSKMRPEVRAKQLTLTVKLQVSGRASHMRRRFCPRHTRVDGSCDGPADPAAS